MFALQLGIIGLMGWTSVATGLMVVKSLLKI
jgi:hypothetical protein